MKGPMDLQTLKNYLYANMIAVLAVHETGPFIELGPDSIDVSDDVSILFYHKTDSCASRAQVVLKGNMEGRTPRILDPVEDYLAVVRDVKSLLPARGTLPPGPMATT